MRSFFLVINWQNGFSQTWDYPHLVGPDWVTRDLTADDFYTLASSSVGLRTTELDADFRNHLLEYFFSVEEESNNGGWGTIVSIEEQNA